MIKKILNYCYTNAYQSLHSRCIYTFIKGLKKYYISGACMIKKELMYYCIDALQPLHCACMILKRIEVLVFHIIFLSWNDDPFIDTL